MLLKISLAEERGRKTVFCSDGESFIPRVFRFPVRSKGCVRERPAESGPQLSCRDPRTSSPSSEAENLHWMLGFQ